MKRTEPSLQFQLWGYAYTGDVLERSALIAEQRPGAEHYCPWDQTRASLERSLVSDGVTWRRVPDWWALTHLPMSWREDAHASNLAALNGCYICQPDNPNADEEGCAACDAAFFANPVYMVVE